MPTHPLTTTAGSARPLYDDMHYEDRGHMLYLVRACGSAWFLHSTHVGRGQSWLSPTTSSCRIAVWGFDSSSIRLCQQAIAIRSPNSIHYLCRFPLVRFHPSYILTLRRFMNDL